MCNSLVGIEHVVRSPVIEASDRRPLDAFASPIVAACPFELDDERLGVLLIFESGSVANRAKSLVRVAERVNDAKVDTIPVVHRTLVL
jgi:hypothetical protein